MSNLIWLIAKGYAQIFSDVSVDVSDVSEELPLQSTVTSMYHVEMDMELHSSDRSQCRQFGRFPDLSSGAKVARCTHRALCLISPVFIEVTLPGNQSLQHGFNAAIDKLIQGRGAEISSKKCQILTVWFGKAFCTRLRVHLGSTASDQ